MRLHAPRAARSARGAVAGAGTAVIESAGRAETVPKFLELNTYPSVEPTAESRRLTRLPAARSALKLEVRARPKELAPLVAPPKLKTPRFSSAPLRKDGSVANVRPVAPGVAGVPVPSTQESFCIQFAASWPAAWALNTGLLGAVAVNWSDTDWMVQLPGPNVALNDATADDASKRSAV